MKEIGIIKILTKIKNKLKEDEIRYNNLKLNKTYDDYILKAKISAYRYRRNV